MRKTHLRFLLLALTLSSCSPKEELGDKVVSLFANKSDCTYQFLTMEKDLDMKLDYEKSDSCNAPIMGSAIVASSELYICDLLAKDSPNSSYIEVYFNNSWHLLPKDTTLKVQSIQSYLKNQIYQLIEGDEVYIDNQPQKYHATDSINYIVDDIEDDYVLLSPITFTNDEYGDASGYERVTDCPKLKFRWKKGNEVVPMRIICEW